MIQNFAMRTIGFAAVMEALEDLRPGPSAEWVVGTNVEYAPYVEFGTSRMGAQPYLRPAVDRARGNIDSIAGNADSLDEALRLIALDIEKESKNRCPVDTGHLKGSIAADKV